MDTSIYIEDRNDPTKTFKFHLRELPEEIPFPYTAELNEIKYPGGHRTNQIIGTYLEDIEWTGLFYGTYKDDKSGNDIVAWDRAMQLKAFVGKPVRVIFRVPGYDAGFPGEYIIKEFTPRVRNYLNIEYTIKLVHHERQEKVTPKKTTNIQAEVNVTNINNGLTSIKQNVDNQKVAKKMEETSRIMQSNDQLIRTIPGEGFRIPQ